MQRPASLDELLLKARDHKEFLQSLDSWRDKEPFHNKFMKTTALEIESRLAESHRLSSEQQAVLKDLQAAYDSIRRIAGKH
ncbi:MAG TPA: hypothetical protein VJI71_01705 [Candidatus Norongarragalinales archaeon]|nr:hypothetical protein [Candidatus Norongarragalinales archaeon]